MDISAFAADIDELVDAFNNIDGLELSQMKELWRSRSFSLIHEARIINVNPALFMQALYSCALDFLGDKLPRSKRLGALYVLYILYETQITVPTVKIYLSTDNLENIYSLVQEAKAKGPLIFLRVVNRMMVKGFFLYGSVCVDGSKMKEAYSQLSNKAAERVQNARKRLFASSSASQHFEGNLIKDLRLDEVALLNEEYAMVKQRVYKGGGGGGAGPTTEDDFNNLGSVLGEELREDIYQWMEERKRFFGKEGQESADEEKAGSGGGDENGKNISGEGQEMEQGQAQVSGGDFDAEGGLEDYEFEMDLETELDEN